MKRIFLAGVLGILSWTYLLSQSMSCEALLLKEFPIPKGMDSEMESDLLALQRCGHDLTAVPSDLVGMALMKISIEDKNVTYGDLVSAVDSIQNDPEFKKSKKNAIVMFCFKLFISFLALLLVLYWGRIFFLQIKSKVKMDDILDKME